ncbi:hypothetical protein NPIL_127191 [Nephila pilipes]|uniref:Uncharacterized protein n=1 Tax=Nephila pilipes TaxID=299642 RepID=A0A8X6MTI7_NEPPI|nr:hypothetical protein NPIL_127191 [Nephila pilipes]
MQAQRLAEFCHAASASEKITPSPQKRNAVVFLAARRAVTSDLKPYPEVTDPTCRLLLPALFYRLKCMR